MTVKALSYRRQAWIAFVLVVLATVFLEHSHVDVMVAQFFYLGQGQWLIDKAHQGFDLLFYSTPKHLLIVFELFVIVCWLWRKYDPRHPLPKVFWHLSSLSVRELGYLAMTMLLVPTVVATLKGLTQTPCPVSLTMFDGVLPYLTITENIKQNLGEKCFPAAHASAGFALYALAFVPSLRHYFWWVVILVTGLAWLMGGYKMAIGDHFLSHTLVSMLLAWAICASMAVLFFGKIDKR